MLLGIPKSQKHLTAHSWISQTQTQVKVLTHQKQSIKSGRGDHTIKCAHINTRKTKNQRNITPPNEHNNFPGADDIEMKT